MGTAEAEGQVAKGCERSNLEGRTAAEVEVGGRVGKSERGRAIAGQHGCCPASALATYLVKAWTIYP